jgi:hypothetical protein
MDPKRETASNVMTHSPNHVRCLLPNEVRKQRGYTENPARGKVTFYDLQHVR